MRRSRVGLTVIVAFVLLALGAAGVVAVLNRAPAPAPSLQEVAISAVTATASGDLLAVGSTGGVADAGALARSTDGGLSWTLTRVPLPALNRIATAGTRIVVSRYCLPPSAGGNPVGPAPASCLFASDDDGATWRDLEAGPLVAPTFVDASYGWAHEQFPRGRELLHSSDGGLTWQELDRPCPPNKPLLNQAVVTGHHAGYVLCFAEASAAGQPWSLLQRMASGELLTVAEGTISYGETHDLSDEFVQGFSIRADGAGFIWTSGGVYRTVDGGRAWDVVPAAGLDAGSFWGGGVVLSDDHAYFVRRDIGTGIVEYRHASLRLLVRWPLPPRGAPPPG